MPRGGVLVFPAAQNARDGEDVVGNRDVEVGFGNASGAGFDHEFVGGFVDINCELSWKIVCVIPPIIVPV